MLTIPRPRHLQMMADRVTSLNQLVQVQDKVSPERSSSLRCAKVLACACGSTSPSSPCQMAPTSTFKWSIDFKPQQQRGHLQILPRQLPMKLKLLSFNVQGLNHPASIPCCGTMYIWCPLWTFFSYRKLSIEALRRINWKDSYGKRQKAGP